LIFLRWVFPFLIPLLTGRSLPVIAHKAIEKGVKYADIMASIAELRQKTAKDIYIMVYANHVFSAVLVYLLMTVSRPGSGV
jgi:tryptophan synthase alpha subunit